MCKGSGDATPGLGPLPLTNTGGGLVKTGSGRMLQRSASVVERLATLAPAFAARDRLRALHRDLTVLKQIWVKPLADTGDHAARLEAFYAPQAAAYDSFRANFLHGRKPMLAACAARLPEAGPLVWVDLGGGTAENVASMAKYIDLARFSTIYVVDLCPALCAAARAKAAAAGWANVVVVEADACGWAPPAAAGPAHLVTFSYSLSMIPAFHAAIDAAVGYLDADVGLLGAADFYASAKWDLPLRQQRWATRFFWRGLFDRDGIDVGPERRAYLDHALARVWEDNGAGAVPYVPLLKAPYYCAVYRVPKLAALLAERRAEAPPLFPPSFIYTQSWEDPAADAPWLAVGPGDVCLTLTSGGCNALALCLAGAAAVHSVDCNPAQNALLELKAAAVRRLEHEDVWRLFGEGRHADASALFERELAPFLSQAALRFWRPRVGRYFDPSGGGLHEAGGMGKVVRGARLLARALGLADAVAALAAAPTLARQREVYESLWPVRALRAAPAPLRAAAAAAAEAAIFNRLALWLGGGVPRRQADLIRADGLSVAAYAARTFDGVARASHLAGDNYFYLSCLLGRFVRGNCPAYLTRAGHAALRAGALDALRVEHGFFMDALRARQYDAVILMDHVDWLEEGAGRALAAALGEQVRPGGRVIWRSAALEPRHAAWVAAAGFEVRCVRRADDGHGLMDRVNMYASFHVATRRAE